jgi:hypothetical protein
MRADGQTDKTKSRFKILRILIKRGVKTKFIIQAPLSFKKKKAPIILKKISPHYFQNLNHVYSLRTTTVGSHALSSSWINMQNRGEYKLHERLQQDWQYTCRRSIQARSCIHCCRGKAISVKQYNFVCLYSCHSYPSCKERAPYYIVCLDVKFFSHCLINGTLFVKELLDVKRVFRLSLQLLSENLSF